MKTVLPTTFEDLLAAVLEMDEREHKPFTPSGRDPKDLAREIIRNECKNETTHDQ
jgi:hypothetical protein